MWTLRRQRRRLRVEHEPEAIARRLADGPRHNYLRDFIYGAIDGAVTTFAIVSGVAGAGLSSGIVIILGLANLLADGFSMAVSNFLGTRAENELRTKLRAEEEQHIRLYPEGEREEVRQIFAAKGFSGEQLEQVVAVITADRDRWVDTMLQDEHGMSLSGASAVKAGSATFLAFILAGSLPLLPFLLNWGSAGLIAQPFLASAVLTLIAFFVIGVAKATQVSQSWYRGGLETLLIGGVAAALAFGVGLALKGTV